MLQELTFVDSVLLITVFDLAAVRGKFSCKNTPKFTARPELGRTNPILAVCIDCMALLLVSIFTAALQQVHASMSFTSDI